MQQVILVVGDLLAFLFFGALGRASHELELSLATAIGAAYPFALGWLVMGLILGTFRPERAVRPLEAVKWAWLTWVAACVYGNLGLRVWPRKFERCGQEERATPAIRENSSLKQPNFKEESPRSAECGPD